MPYRINIRYRADSGECTPGVPPEYSVDARRRASAALPYPLPAMPHDRLRPLLPLRRTDRAPARASRASTRSSSPSSRSARATRAATSGCVTVTNARDRPGARKARVLGRRQHPFDRGRGVGRRAVFPAHARHGLRQRCRRHARARHARVLRLPAHQSRRRRMGARRQAEMGALEHAPLSVRRGGHRGADASRTSTATAASCRCASPIRTACGRRIREEPRLMVRREPDRDGRHVLPRASGRHATRTTTATRCKVKRPRQGLDLNRNFPASWRQEFEQLGAGPYPTSEPGDARGRRLHRPPSEHHRRHVVPHVERRAAAAVRAPVRRRDGRRGPVVLPGARDARAPS